MSDSADELILKMQHLEAQAKLSAQARQLGDGAERLKTAGQKVAAEAQREIATCELLSSESEQLIERAKTPGLPPLEAGELLRRGRAQAEDARSRLVKARARLQYALDRMEEGERREYEAAQAEVRAQTHGELAEEPT